MKKIALLLTILISVSLSAQMKVKINGKLITEQTITKAEDIKKFEVAFDKPKQLDYYGLGRLYILVEFFDEKGDSKEEYGIRKDGANAIKAFLEDVNVFYPMASESDPTSEFQAYRVVSEKSITPKLKTFGKIYDSKVVKIKVSVCFQDKIGYEKYGDCVYLVKPQTYTINNTLFYTEGQKEKEQDKIVAAQKAEEKAKADEEARKQKEAEEKKGKGKKLLKNVLGW
jgi:hypothetical protein